jgi:hypothetical protein
VARYIRRQLASIPAPAPALHLRALLLRLADAQVGVTREVTKRRVAGAPA